MKFLFLIPARGGSKGIPGKNIKPLAGKPLIHYSIELAREFARDEDICLSTDDEAIAQAARQTSLNIPFIRPDELATDSAGSYDFIMHAVNHYEANNKNYDAVVLLQPTSPLRTKTHLKEMLEAYSNKMDMLVSVTKAEHNPICVSFTENDNGHLKRLFGEESTLRQNVPDVYNYNGAIYIMNVESLKKNSYNDFKAIHKYVMDEESSLDLDTPFHWEFMEFIMSKRKKC